MHVHLLPLLHLLWMRRATWQCWLAEDDCTKAYSTLRTRGLPGTPVDERYTSDKLMPVPRCPCCLFVVPLPPPPLPTGVAAALAADRVAPLPATSTAAPALPSPLHRYLGQLLEGAEAEQCVRKGIAILRQAIQEQVWRYRVAASRPPHAPAALCRRCCCITKSGHAATPPAQAVAGGSACAGSFFCGRRAPAHSGGGCD